MNWAEISLICGAILAMIGVATWVLRKLIPWLRKWSRVADRILGVPADPQTGQDAIPSIWERLDHQDDVLGVIKHEVEYNNSTSLKDAVRRTENHTKSIGEKLDAYMAGKSEAPTVTVVNANATGITPA